jgi:hypothetical protein
MAHKMKSHGKGHHMKHHSDPIVGGESEREGRVMGHGEFANMPKDVHMKAYPKAHEMGGTVEDDTMGRVDKENMQAHRQSRRNMSNQH